MDAIQLDLFENMEFADEESQIKARAKKYTAANIFQCAGIRGEIRYYLEAKEPAKAFNSFDQAFGNYGFAFMDYSFSAFGGKGKIRVKDQFDFLVTSKVLFAEILILWNEEKEQLNEQPNESRCRNVLR